LFEFEKEKISLNAKTCRGRGCKAEALEMCFQFFGGCQSINFKRNRAWNAVDALIKLVEIEKN
jgi:hypothetical protein